MSIFITPRAAKKVFSKAAAAGLTDFFFRVGLRAGGCMGVSENFDFCEQPTEKDIVFEREGIKIVVGPKSMTMLEGATIDWSKNLMNQKFEIQFAEKGKTCSCGASFSL